jgi:hypothetical protein
MGTVSEEICEIISVIQANFLLIVLQKAIGCSFVPGVTGLIKIELWVRVKLVLSPGTCPSHGYFFSP